MTDKLRATTRRGLIGLAGAGLLIGKAAAQLKAEPVPAAPPVRQTGYPAVSKASVGYRDIPWHGEVCGACVWFEPPSGGSSTSRCKLVAGPISPAGWCQAWVKRG